MNKTSGSAVAVASFSIIAASSVHAVVLVDYDDGDPNNGVHDSSIRNGGFEDNVIADPPSPPGGTLSFANTDFWYNIGTGSQGGEAINNNSNFSDLSVQTGIVAESPTRVFGMDTGYTLSSGDLVNFSYFWRDAFNWDDASDQLTFSIFTTVDDTIDGAVDQSETSLGALSAANSSFQEHSGTLVATAAMDGKNLFIEISNVDGNAAPNGFARIDNVFVEAIPEPSVLSLLGLGGLLAVRRRRG